MHDDGIAESLSKIAQEFNKIAACWGQETTLFTPAPDLRRRLEAINVDQLLGSGMLRAPYLTVRDRGTEVALEEYTETRKAGSSKFAGFIVESKVRSLLAEGCTLLFSYTEQWIPAVAEALDWLRAGLQAKGGATLFYTPAGHRGLDPHRDASHVFVIQLSGTKRWLVERRAPVDPDWNPAVDEAAFYAMHENLHHVDLSEGMGVYMPAGVAHVASSNRDPSLHLSLYIIDPKPADLIYAAAVKVARDFPVNTPVPMPGTERILWGERMLQMAARKLESLDAGDLVAETAYRPLRDS
jgi:hypothetical protein